MSVATGLLGILLSGLSLSPKVSTQTEATLCAAYRIESKLSIHGEMHTSLPVQGRNIEET
jgi:hypothetical protein